MHLEGDIVWRTHVPFRILSIGKKCALRRTTLAAVEHWNSNSLILQMLSRLKGLLNVFFAFSFYFFFFFFFQVRSHGNISIATTSSCQKLDENVDKRDSATHSVLLQMITKWKIGKKNHFSPSSLCIFALKWNYVTGFGRAKLQITVLAPCKWVKYRR